MINYSKSFVSTLHLLCLLLLPIAILAPKEVAGQSRTPQKNFATANLRNKASNLILLAEKTGRTNPQQGIKTIRQAIDIGKKLKDNAIIARSMIVYSNLIYQVSDLNSSSKTFDEAYFYAVKSSDSLLIFTASRNILSSCRENDNPFQKNQLDLIAHFTSTKKNDSIRAWARYETGLLKNSNLTTKKEARNYLAASLEWAKKNGDEQLAALSKVALFYHSGRLAQSDSSSKLLFEAIDYFTKNDYLNELAIAENYLADQYRLNGQFVKAHEHYSIALNKSYQIENRLIMGLTHAGILQTYLAESNYQQMLVHIEKADALYKTIGYLNGRAWMQNFRGQYHSSTGNITLAASYFDSADSMNKTVRSEELRMVNLSYRAINSYRMGSKKQGDSSLLNVLNSINNNVPKQLQQKVAQKSDQLQELAGISKENRKITSSFFLDSVYRNDIAGKIPISDLKTVNFVIDSLNTSTGLTKNLDSIIGVINNQKLAELETKYNVKQKSDSLKIQVQTNRLVESELKRKNMITNLSVAFSLVLLGLLYLLFRSNKKIKEDKEIIQGLQREIHHRVKNNFEAAGALVEKTAIKLGNRDTLLGLQNRLASFWKLHEHLYGTKKSTGKVNMNDYLRSICDLIKDPFDLEKEVSIEVLTDAELLMENAQIVGLIVNELVTNSFKYAFKDPDRSDWSIKISLSQQKNTDYYLSVKDNGVGFDTSVRHKSYGIILIKGKANEIKSDYQFSNQQGTLFEMTFKDLPRKITDSI